MSDRNWLTEVQDDAAVSCALHPYQPPGRGRLEPRLWEALRLRLQSVYRRATGETSAVISIKHEDASL